MYLKMSSFEPKLERKTATKKCFHSWSRSSELEKAWTRNSYGRLDVNNKYVIFHLISTKKVLKKSNYISVADPHLNLDLLHTVGVWIQNPIMKNRKMEPDSDPDIIPRVESWPASIKIYIWLRIFIFETSIFFVMEQFTLIQKMFCCLLNCCNSFVIF